MPYKDLPGFLARATAQKQFGRSKSSFIRDVDDAFDRGDTEFLENFRVLLNDGGEIAGPEATKKAVQAQQSKQPRWFVKLDLLETRYWDRDGGDTVDADNGATAKKRSLSSAEIDVEVRHLEALLSERDRLVERLERDKSFLQEELTNRRGEIDKLRGFFESIGDAADSTAKLREASRDTVAVADGDTVQPPSQTSVRQQSDSRSWLKRHTPNVRKIVDYFRQD